MMILWGHAYTVPSQNAQAKLHTSGTTLFGTLPDKETFRQGSNNTYYRLSNLEIKGVTWK